MRADLRPAVSGDINALAALDGQVNPSPWTPAQFVDACRLKPEGTERALVVECDGQLAGFIVYSRVLDEVCVHNIAVVSSLRCQGLGRLLLAAVLDRARSGGAVRCYLEVRESNRAARKFYQKHGFRPDGLRRNYYPAASGREDAVLMSRQLSEQES